MKVLPHDISGARQGGPAGRRKSVDWEKVINVVSDMITIHDRDFNVLFANSTASAFLKLPPLENGAVPCFKYFHGTGCPHAQCPARECLKTGRPATLMLYEPHLKKHLEIRTFPLAEKKRDTSGVIHIARDITKRRKAEQKLRDSRAQLRRLNAHILSLREQERESVAREIHDELGQSISVLQMELRLLERDIPRQRRDLCKKTSSLLEILETTIRSVQRLSAELRPTLIDDLGLPAAIRWQARNFQARTGIACSVSCGREPVSLGRTRSMNIFRIFQEALTNVYRHARAKKVSVRIRKESGRFVMTVEDDGRGITGRQVSDSRSFGILGMRERVHFLKGDIEIKGAPGKGSVVTVVIPL